MYIYIDIYLHLLIEHFVCKKTVKVCKKANVPYVVKFLEDCYHNTAIPRNVRLDEARSLVGKKVNIFCKKKQIYLNCSTH